MTAPSSPAPEPTLLQSAARSSIFIIFSLAQLYLAGFVVPRFVSIFHDMLGNQPLPHLTVSVIDYRWAAAAFACLCTVAAIFVARHRKSAHWLIAIAIVLLLQIGVTIIALFMPLTHTIIRQAP